MAGKPSQKVRSKDATQRELNLLPVMNVIMILIPFLIMTAALVELTIIDTSLPSRGSSSDGKTDTSPDKPKLNLTVFITNEGFILAGYGGVLQVNNGETEGEENAAPESKRFKIEKVAAEDKNGKKAMDYDWDKLAKNLKKVKKSYPDHYSIIILPDNDVKYDTIIKLMDISREYAETKNGKEVKKPMFPNPVLAWSVT